VPELPDVETFARYLQATALGRRVRAVHVPDPELLGGTTAQALGRALHDRRLARRRRRGKWLFASAEGDGWLALHFGMTGELQAWDGVREPPEHTALLLELERDRRLAYVCQRKFGELRLVDSPEALIAERGLGPDALDDPPTVAELRERLSSRPGPIKTALCDQSFLAGLGNVYADEVLFQAGIHPDSTSNEVPDDALEDLRRELRRVLEHAIEAQADPERLPRSWLLPNREQGAGCPKCGAELRHEQRSGRPVHFCPDHQERVDRRAEERTS